MYAHYNDACIRTADGLLSLATHLPSSISFIWKLHRYILEHEFDEVLLVDFPLVNVPLAYLLKRAKPELQVTYLAPPELWAWGRFGVDKILRSCCDKIVVLYPFEKAWYGDHGLEVVWEGYPFLDDYAKAQSGSPITKQIALLPGSRKSELQTMLPIFAQVVTNLSQQYPDVSFVLPRAESFSTQQLTEKLREVGLEGQVRIVEPKDKVEQLSRSALAISKPGTNTLELALLGVPTIIIYRLPRLTYQLVQMLLQVPYVGLPNLILGKEICPELLQDRCTAESITEEAGQLYEQYLNNDEAYAHLRGELARIENHLVKP